MPLERQVITMPLAQGVDTKTDAKQVAAGKLLELENGVFTTLKAIRKRNGNVALSRNVGSMLMGITSGKALATYRDELLEANGSALYSYDSGADSWVNKGNFVSLEVTQTPVVRDNYNQACPDGATHSSGLEAYAWEDSSSANTVRYAIIDGYSGQTVVSSRLLASAAIKPRVLAVNNFFLFYWVNPSTHTIKLAQLPITTPDAVPTVTTLTGSDSSTNSLNTTGPNYDAAIVGGGIALAFNNAAGSTTLRMYDAGAPTQALYPQTTIAYPSRSLSVFSTWNGESEQGPTVAFSTSDDIAPLLLDVRFATFNYTLTTLVSSGKIASPSTYFCQVAGIQSPGKSIGFQVYFDLIDGSSAITIKANITFDPTVSIPATPTISVTNPWRQTSALWGKPFTYGNGIYVPLSYTRNVTNATIQKTYFLVDSNGYIAAKGFEQTAGDYPRATYNTLLSSPLLANAWPLGNGAFRIACTQQALTSGTGIDTPFDVSALTFNFEADKTSYAFATLGGDLHSTGGMVQMYDGVQVVEHGFNLYPDYISATATNTPAGSLSTGKYYYAVVYEWFDAQGTLHQSRPRLLGSYGTLPQDNTISVTAGQSVDLKVPYLQFTNKTASPVQIIIYRTQADKLVLYRATALVTPAANLNVINGANETTINDGLSDADLALRPQMYTQPLVSLNTGVPAVVENDPAPPASLIQLHRNKLWVLDSTNPLQLWYSKDVGIGYPVEFNSGFVKQIDPRGGNVTALATVDDKLLVFKKSHIFFIVGQGPNNVGENNDLSDAILITTDCGCIDPRSVVGTPVGIMFQSAKGIYLIDRSLQVQYVGAPVEAYNQETITSATLVSNTNQVRFTLESGKTLVFDYFVQQWGTFTNQHAVDSIVWQDSMMLLRANGTVLRETPNVFTDAGSPIKLKLATSWLSFANVQGFQRVRRAQILGAWKSPHNLLVSLAVNFNDNIVQQATITPTTPTPYGGSSPYGAESVYGGEFQLYQWRFDLAQQKTQAVKLIIEDLPAATAGEGLSLTSLGFEVGAKTGLNKVPASQIVS